MSGAAWWCAAPAGLGLAATSQAAASASADGCPGAPRSSTPTAPANSRGRVSVTHVVDERGYSVMLAQPEQDGV